MTDSYTKKFIVSATATTVAEVVTLPLCTIKTNYQNTNSNSIPNTIKMIYHDRGIAGFYRASFPAISSQILSTSSKYMSYSYFKTKTDNYPLAGFLSGACSSLVTQPFDSIKVYYQMNTTWQFKYMYQGYSKTFLKASLGSTLFWPINDTINKYSNNLLISSFSSAVISTIVMQPFDYIKTTGLYGLNFSIKNVYKGLTLNLMRVVPHFIITVNMINYLSQTI